MKMNLEFYKGQDLYCDGQIEEEIIEYAKKYDNENIEEVFKNDMRWPVFYHLTKVRHNILSWYEMKPDSDVLEIGAGMGAITGVLCDKAKHVTAVDLSKQRATCIATRHENRDNLEIIVGNFNDIKFDKKFDYITLIGVFEYGALYTDTDNPFHDFLEKIKGLLKEDGKLLIAIENKFGLKYFAGAVEDHTSIKYDGLSGYENKKGVRTFGKNELSQILKESGLTHMKFYYPLPDYKLPNVIFSDTHMPDENTINYYEPYYYDNTKLNFDEKKVYNEIIKEGNFEFFSNSYFVECSRKELDNKTDFALFESLKNQNNRKMTIHKEDKYYNGSIKSQDLKEIKKEDLNQGNREDLNEEMVNFFQRKYEYIDTMCDELNVKNSQLNEELSKIYHSRSWKFSRPFRDLSKMLKGRK